MTKFRVNLGDKSVLNDGDLECGSAYSLEERRFVLFLDLYAHTWI